MNYPHRRVGTIGVHPVEPTGVYADSAKTRQKQRQERIALRRENFVMLNRHSYKPWFEEWVAKGGGKLPHCPRCDATIHWNEPAHVCPVKLGTEEWKPKYEVWTDERKEQAQARREAIREARVQNPIVCSVCREEMPEYEDAERHWDAHEGVPEREHQAVSGDEDDLSGYEDWCDEDESYVEDDGDPDWD